MRRRRYSTPLTGLCRARRIWSHTRFRRTVMGGQLPNAGCWVEIRRPRTWEISSGFRTQTEMSKASYQLERKLQLPTTADQHPVWRSSKMMTLAWDLDDIV